MTRDNDAPANLTQLETLLYLYRLKDETRTGWVLRDVKDPESVADHSWGTAFLCLLFAEGEGVDEGRCLAMAAVHDIAEAETGDVAARVHPSERSCSPEEKQLAEARAMEKLSAGLRGNADAFTGSFGNCAAYPPVADFGAGAGLVSTAGRVFELWREYEDAVTRTAAFVRDMNLVDMCLQALFYERGKRYTESAENPHFRHFKGLDEFFATSGPRLRTETGRRLYGCIKLEYDRLREKTR